MLKNNILKKDYVSFAKNLMSEENPIEFEKKLSFFYKQAKEIKSKPLQRLDDLLEDNFIIGESHSHISSKKFLIANMKRLKEAGFTTLFIEHLLYDEHQEQLNNYNLSDNKDAKLEDELANYLEEQDNGFGVPNFFGPRYKETTSQWDKNNFTMLIKAAKEAGIRVVALDCTYEYEEQRKHQNLYGKIRDNYRIRSMNFTAFQIISEEMANKNEKWVALMGNGHTKMNANIIGVAELTGARSIYIFDNRDNKTTITYHFPLHLKDDHNNIDVIADVHIENDIAKDAPIFSPLNKSLQKL